MKKEDIKLIRQLFLEVDKKSKDTYQIFSKFWEILDYLEGDKTEGFKRKLEKEYPLLKEVKI